MYSISSKVLYILLAISLMLTGSLRLSAQTGEIAGKMVDVANGELLIGATAVVEGTSSGAVTDLDGTYIIKNVAPGTYTIIISSIGFEGKRLPGIIVTAGKTTTLDITMRSSVVEKKEVVVTAEQRKESVSAILVQQKNAVAVQNGISAESIRQSPDRNTGEVLKRVSGASIQDNKFAIIRGLNDRYNSAMINGAPLPSSEPDRRAFSFNLFPSNMLENLIIIKTATPDMPGDFSGGIIMLNTKDIPNENFTSLSLSTGLNSISTNKEYKSYNDYGGEKFGFTSPKRFLPSGFPATVQEFSNLPKDKQIEQGHRLNNDYAIMNGTHADPFTGLQFSLGRRYKVAGNDLGLIVSTNYQNQRRYYEVSRAFYEDARRQVIDIHDQQYSRNITTGVLANLSYKVGQFNKFSWKNTLSANNDDVLTLRMDRRIEDDQIRRGYNYFYTGNTLALSQFNGDHYFEKRKMKLDYVLSYGYIQRDIPDLRSVNYYNTISDPSPQYAANITNSVSKEEGGRFFSKLRENTYGGTVNFTMPADVFSFKNSLKFGGTANYRDRVFDARNIGYKQDVGFDPSITVKPVDSIFRPENVRNKGVILSEFTLPTDKYSANAKLFAAYFMLDSRFTNKLRLVYGVRFESQRQLLRTTNYASVSGQKVIVPFDVNKKFDDFLPSANFIYSLTKKANFRASYAMTVSRPEFRELSLFSFYDFNLLGLVSGNPDLKRAQIQNFDLRYEIYPNANETFSASLFYKRFKDPIEMILQDAQNLGTFNRNFQNIASAENYGAEIEFRKGLGFIGSDSGSFFDKLTLFGNYAYIYSQIHAIGVTEDVRRPLQGQSPYIINTGIQYYAPKRGFNASILFNRVGRRISEVGTTTFPDIYENPRSILDAQISQLFFKRLEVKVSVSDIFGNDFIYFQDIHQASKKNIGRKYIDDRYEEGKDQIIYRRKVGRNFGFSVTYRF